jgi:hypothetical protein
MTIDELDTKLRQLREATERAGANLVELEIDSSRKLLEASSLAGESAERWSAASSALTELWEWRGLLEELLEKADQLRGERRLRAEQLEELGTLLVGRSIELSTSEVPLAERDLLGRPEVSRRCSPDGLLTRMSAAFNQVKTVVAEIAGAWEQLIPRVDAARRLLGENQELAEVLGEAERRDLETTQEALVSLGASLTTDPLSVAPADVDALERSLDAVHRDLEATARLKREFDSRMVRARELLDTLRAAILDGRAAHEEVTIKISVPGAPEPLAPGDDGGAELAKIASLAERGAWRDARRSLEQWAVRTGAALDEANQILRANRAPIEARNQFRSLLDAYQVKAMRLGLVEDPALAAIFAEAHEELYNAPTDLALVGRLVRRYQEGLTTRSHPPEARL